MNKTWKILKFYIPSELEGFKDKQEEIIKKVLKDNNVLYKFINEKWAFLCDDEIERQQVQKLKQSFISYLKEVFINELEKITVDTYNHLGNIIYKFTFPESIQPECFDVDIFKETFGLAKKQFDEALMEEFEAEVEKNVLFFEGIETDLMLQESASVNKLIDPLSKNVFDIIDISIEIIDKEEIIYSFEIINKKDIQEEEIIDCVQARNDIKIVAEDTENNIIKEIEYQYGIKSSKSLVHDIRKERILICNYNSYLEVSLIFLGYMKIDDDKIYITIKTFEYEILNKLIDMFKEKFDILLETNLLWSRLLSRKIGKEYNERRRNLEENQLCKDFLKISINKHMCEFSLYVLEKVLKKGYLTKEEYEETSKGLECAIKEKKEISRFFQKYFRIEKQQIQHKSFWVNSISNKIYLEKESKTDPQRIVDITEKIQQIYAPTEQLLEYIKCFWHQNYVRLIIESIKKEWEEQNKDLRIVSIITDMQFNLRDKFEKTKKSIDIDILLKLKKLSSNKEFIISVEAKQKSNEIKENIKELTEKSKISYEYANIFDGFLMIAYIDDMIDENKMKLNSPEYCQVQFSAAQEGIDNIIKPYLLSVDHSFDRLKSDVALNLKKICESA